jgi:glycosyltransferase involved in cell wall biosynthesis
MCHIWLAPTMSEGLHLPPAEAMLTECPVVCTNAELSGMQDYVVNNETGIMTSNDFWSFVKGVETLIKDEQLRISCGKKARDKILSIGSRDENMSKLIKYLESLQVKTEEERWKN